MKLLELLDKEMDNQNFKWGEQNHPDGTGLMLYHVLADKTRKRCDEAVANGKVTWRHILLEEVYEALAEDNPKTLSEELVQVAAVALQWVGAIQRREMCAELEGDRRPGNPDADIYKVRPAKLKKKPRKARK